MTNDNVCPKCSKSITASGSGFVTQFIDVCRCDELPPDQYLTVQMCSRCGMRVPRKSGTMTQWIFGHGNCQCENPELVNTQIDAVPDLDLANSITQYEVNNLNLDPEKFPTERYLPVKELGRGAAGTVYLSIDKMLDKAVAVKTLINLSSVQLISFQDEARATAKLDHPNIVKILDFGVSNSDIPYMVMEYIAGVSLERYILEEGALSTELFKSIFIKLSHSLGYAHRHRIFHRDIKPSNIILFESEDGVDLKVIDFGIAKAKKESGMVTIYNDNSLAGTPSYMAPDVVNGNAYDARSEIYSVGCVMFEALAGKPPFLAETALETLSLHVHNQVPDLTETNPDVDEEVSHLVARCLSKERQERFANMNELSQALSEIRGPDVEDGLEATSYDVKESRGKRSLLIPIIVGGLFLTGCISFLLLTYFSEPTTSQSDSKFKKVPVKARPEISSLSHQERVKFISVDLSGDRLNNLVGKSIGEIDFDHCTLDGASFRYLKQVRNLNRLNFSSSKLDMKDFQILNDLKSFRALELRDMNVDGLASIAGLNLSKLVIANCRRPNIDASAPLDLSELKKLRYLLIEFVPLKECEVNSVSGLKRLQNLCLDLDKKPSNLLSISKKHVMLKVITIRNTKLENAFIDRLVECPRLNSLSFIWCNVEKPGVVKDLVKSKSLNTLSYATCKFSKDTIKEFSSIKKLKKLRLLGYYSKILNNIGNARLKVLILENNTYITDDGLRELLKRGLIEKVQIAYCPNVSKKYLKELDDNGMLIKDEKLVPMNADSELIKLFQHSDK